MMKLHVSKLVEKCKQIGVNDCEYPKRNYTNFKEYR